MSPNLSFERFAIVLALTGCSKATPAAETSTVRSDPQASAQATTQGAVPPPVIGQASGVTTTATPGAPAPRGGASATELKKKMSDTHTGQASCGAGSCTSEIKKK